MVVWVVFAVSVSSGALGRRLDSGSLSFIERFVGAESALFAFWRKGLALWCGHCCVPRLGPANSRLSRESMEQTDSVCCGPDSTRETDDCSAASPLSGEQTATGCGDESSTPGLVRILLKTPTMMTESAGRAHLLLIEPDSTVGELKRKICLDHPVHPAPEHQRLVYAGRLLRDEECIHQIVGLSRKLPEDAATCLRDNHSRQPMAAATNALVTAGTSGSAEVYAVFHLVISGQGAACSNEGATGHARAVAASTQQPESPSRTDTNSIPSTSSGEVMTFSEASRERLGSVSDTEPSPAPSLTTIERPDGSTEVSPFDETQYREHDHQRYLGHRDLDQQTSDLPQSSLPMASSTSASNDSASLTNSDGRAAPLRGALSGQEAASGAANVLLHLDEQTLRLIQAYTRMVRAYEDYNACLTAYYAARGMGPTPPVQWLARRGPGPTTLVSGPANGQEMRPPAAMTGFRPAERPTVPGVVRGPGSVGVPVRLVAVRIRLPALDWALIIKLAFMVLLLGQDGGRDRLALLIGLAVLIYLFQTGALGPLRQYLESLSSQLIARVQAGAGLRAPTGSAPRPATNPGQMSMATSSSTSTAPAQPETVSARVLRFLRAFYVALVAFVCSLFPTWRPPLPPAPRPAA